MTVGTSLTTFAFAQHSEECSTGVCPMHVPFAYLPEESVAIRNEDWPAIHKAIQDAIAPLKPRGWKKALHLLREWGVLGTLDTVIIALLALAATAFYQAIA